MEAMHHQLCLPIEIAKSLYSKWDAEVALIEAPNVVYSKALDGNSTLEFKNGNIYEGEMSRGLLHGKGTFKWTSGVVYQGEFQNNVIEGKGKYTWPDGSTYVGDVHNGRKQGFGEFVSKQENAVYTGEWREGQRNGRGKIEFGNGSVFDGTFSNGIKNGPGKMTYPSGNFYEGMWVNDIKQGFGTMVWITTNEKYIGNWHNNKQNGQGMQIWLENRAEFKVFRNRYDGNWVDGRREGYGTFYFSTGGKYEGYWHNNMKEGFGMQTEENGQVKIGLYKADRPMKREMGETILKQSAPLSQVIHQQQSLGLLPPLRTLEASSIPKDPKTLGQIKDLKKIGKKPSNTKLQPSKRLEQATSRPLNSLHQTQPQPSQTPSIQPVVPQQPLNILRNLDAEQNPYGKYLDIQNFEISESILNFLLRSHSMLKHLYKQYSCTKEYFSGMSLECAWKMLRDLKLIDERCSIAMVDREFARGYKSWFPLSGQPEQRLLLLQKQSKHWADDEISKLELIHHSNQLANSTFSFDELSKDSVKLRVDNEPFSPSAIYRGQERNLHDGGTVLLFRHFVCILVRIVKMKYCYGSNSDSELKAALEKLLNRLSQQCENKQPLNDSTVRNTLRLTSTDLVSFKSGFAVGKQVLEWAKSMNERLFDRMTIRQRSLIGTVDKTVPFKTILRLLERTNYLKEPYERMMFLEKVERYMDVKVGYFKKQFKQQAASIMSQLDKSPVFQPLLNTEVNLWQFHELIYAAITKKIATSNSQDEVKLKYQEAIQLLIEGYVSAENQGLPIRNSIPLRKVETEKDRQKKALLQRIEQQRLEKVRQAQLRVEAERAEHERLDMEANDFNVPSEAYLQDSEQQP